MIIFASIIIIVLAALCGYLIWKLHKKTYAGELKIVDGSNKEFYLIIKDPNDILNNDEVTLKVLK